VAVGRNEKRESMDRKNVFCGQDRGNRLKSLRPRGREAYGVGNEENLRLRWDLVLVAILAGT